MSSKCYLIFPSTYWALTTERTLQQRQFDVRLRPVPRTLSSSCGLCLELNTAIADQIQQLVTSLHLQAEGPMTSTGEPIHTGGTDR